MGGILTTDMEDAPTEGHAKPWTRVGTTHFNNWSKTASILWNFDPNINYTFVKEPRLQPWCVSNRHFSVELIDFSSNGLCGNKYGANLEITQRRQRASNSVLHKIHLPFPLNTMNRKDLKAPFNNALKPLQVVGQRGDIAVLQANCLFSRMQFIVVNLRSGDYIGRHVEMTSGEPYLCECIISPDCSKFLLKPNSVFISDIRSSGRDYPSTMKLVTLDKNGQCDVERTFSEEGCVSYVVSFDPRFKHSRLAVGNFNGGKNMCVFDLRRNEVIMKSDERANTPQTARNIVYSPDGQYLACLMSGVSYQAGLHNFPNVNIYDADTLMLLQTVLCSKMYYVALIPAVLFPLFSECGTRLAVAYGRNIDIMGSVFGQELAFVEIYRVPVKRSLQRLCRVTIRRAVSGENVLLLPLPRKIKDYLLYRPVYA